MRKKIFHILFFLLVPVTCGLVYAHNSATDSSELVHAIYSGERKLLEQVIQDVPDPDRTGDLVSPLFHAIRAENKYALKLLLEKGANINQRDSSGMTPLMLAARIGHRGTVRVLLREYANVTLKTKNGMRAYDFAIRAQNLDIASKLKQEYEKHLPDMQDGPHVQWKWNDRIKVLYLVHDSTKQIARRIRMRFSADTNFFEFRGYGADTNRYRVHENPGIPSAQFEMPEKLMVIGDIHGCYDSLIVLLQKHRVINKAHRWIWGQGHLVFLGDIFDRGDKVTEALWLIYSLEHQAERSGGKVHLLLGNHEILVLNGNPNYLSEKYYYLTEKNEFPYDALFGIKTVLGEWIRTKNTLIRVGDLLFVHGGISPEVASRQMDIDQINDLLRFFLEHPGRKNYNPEIRALLLGKKGPFWYRGFVESNHDYERLDAASLEKILDQYHAEKILIGHTNVNRIQSLYKGNVIALDVPFYTCGFSMQVLMIENNRFYTINTRGEKHIFP